MISPLLLRFSLLALAFFACIYLVGNALTPFLLGTIFAYIAFPFVGKLTKLGLSQTAGSAYAVILAILVVLLVPLLVLPILFSQAVDLANTLPDFIEQARVALAKNIPFLNDISLKDSLDYVSDAPSLTAVKQASSTFFSWLGAGISIVGTFLVILIITPLVMFYLLRDWSKITKDVILLFPEAWQEKIKTMAQISDKVLSEFLRAQLLVVLIMVIVYSILLSLAGLPYALVIGTLSGLLTFIPVVGFFIGFALAILIATIQLGGIIDIGWVIGAMLVGNVLESFIITPKIVGERSGLGPVTVLLALTSMGSVFGITGMLIAIPLAAVLTALWRHFKTSG